MDIENVIRTPLNPLTSTFDFKPVSQHNIAYIFSESTSKDIGWHRIFSTMLNKSFLVLLTVITAFFNYSLMTENSWRCAVNVEICINRTTCKIKSPYSDTWYPIFSSTLRVVQTPWTDNSFTAYYVSNKELSDWSSTGDFVQLKQLFWKSLKTLDKFWTRKILPPWSQLTALNHLTPSRTRIFLQSLEKLNVVIK